MAADRARKVDELVAHVRQYGQPELAAQLVGLTESVFRDEAVLKRVLEAEQAWADELYDLIEGAADRGEKGAAKWLAKHPR